MTLNTYLHFDGNCREAFEFYRSIFGGDFDMVSTFRDGPPDMDMGVPEAELDNIMHVSLTIGPSALMGSDVPSTAPMKHVAGSNFSISVSPETRTETDEIFAKLCDGGSVHMPLGEMFWGSYFGACVDKFGVQWMVNCDA